MNSSRPYWKRYYHTYVGSFIAFLVPKGKQVGYTSLTSLPSGQFDYLIALDSLGEALDIESFLTETRTHVTPTGRLILTHYNALWEPILRLASWLKLRKVTGDQNWLTMGDLKNLAYLSHWEVVRSGTKLLLPLYLPIISWLSNKFLAQWWPFSKLGLFHYLVLRKTDPATATTTPSISIIVPARNEAGMIGKIVSELPQLGAFTEIIFVEGHSTDHTLKEIKQTVVNYRGNKRLRYAVQTGRGKGDAVRLGFELAEGDVLAIYDADMTVPPEELKKFYQALVNRKADFINGSRLVYPMKKESMRTINFLGNKFFSLAFTWILGQTIKDTLCGTKVLWREDYHSIKANRAFFGDFDPFGDFDLILGAAKLNLKIIDLPVHYRERTYGITNINRFRHGWLLLKMTLFAMKKLRFR